MTAPSQTRHHHGHEHHAHEHREHDHAMDAPASLARPAQLRVSWLRHAAASRLLGVSALVICLWLAVFWALA